MPLLGANEVRAALGKAMAGADAAARVIVVKGGSIVEAAAKRNFQGSHKKGMPHVGGSQPNVVSGNLRRSITHSAYMRLGFASYGTSVGPTAIYGRRVEYGYNGSRGYPYFEPAAISVAPQLQELARTTWARYLNT